MGQHLQKLFPLILFIAVILISNNWWRLRLAIDPINTTHIEAADVTLYATQWCSYCAKTRRFFETAGIPFREYDIEASATAYRAYQQLGGRGVPLIMVGDAVIVGYDTGAIRDAVASLEPYVQIPTARPTQP